jgi:hypothetical protein
VPTTPGGDASPTATRTIAVYPATVTPDRPDGLPSTGAGEGAFPRDLEMALIVIALVAVAAGALTLVSSRRR